MVTVKGKAVLKNGIGKASEVEEAVDPALGRSRREPPAHAGERRWGAQGHLWVREKEREPNPTRFAPPPALAMADLEFRLASPRTRRLRFCAARPLC